MSESGCHGEFNHRIYRYGDCWHLWLHIRHEASLSRIPAAFMNQFALYIIAAVVAVIFFAVVAFYRPTK